EQRGAPAGCDAELDGARRGELGDEVDRCFDESARLADAELVLRRRCERATEVDVVDAKSGVVRPGQRHRARLSSPAWSRSRTTTLRSCPRSARRAQPIDD